MIAIHLKRLIYKYFKKFSIELSKKVEGRANATIRCTLSLMIYHSVQKQVLYFSLNSLLNLLKFKSAYSLTFLVDETCLHLRIASVYVYLYLYPYVRRPRLFEFDRARPKFPTAYTGKDDKLFIMM